MRKRRPARRIVRARGGPRECGRAIGEATGPAIVQCYEGHRAAYTGYGAAWDQLAAGYKEHIAVLAPRSAAELQGMAEGAAVDLDVIIKMQCLEELDMYISAYPWLCDVCECHIPPYGGIHCVACSYALCDAHGPAAAGHRHPLRRVQPPRPGPSKARRAALGGGAAAAPPPLGHCSAFAATAAATGADLPAGLCGQTFDWAPQLFAFAQNDTIWHICEDGCPEVLVYANPGVPNAGMNSCGLCLMANTVYSSEAAFSEGLPSCVLVRELLRCETLAAARALLRSGVMATPFNYLLLQGDRLANVEGTGQRVAQSSREDEALYLHTNHFLDRSLSAVELFPQCNTAERYASLRASLLGPAVTQAAAVRAFSLPPVMSPITLGTIICVPHSGLLLVRFGLRDAQGAMCTDPRKLAWRRYQLTPSGATAPPLPPSPPACACEEQLPSLADSEVSMEEVDSPPPPQSQGPNADDPEGDAGLPPPGKVCPRAADCDLFPIAGAGCGGAASNPITVAVSQVAGRPPPSQESACRGAAEAPLRDVDAEEEAYGCCKRGDDGSFCICCDECNRWHHGSCVGLETAFQQAHYTGKGRRWYCDACLRARHPVTCSAPARTRKR